MQATARLRHAVRKCGQHTPTNHLPVTCVIPTSARQRVCGLNITWVFTQNICLSEQSLQWNNANVTACKQTVGAHTAVRIQGSHMPKILG
jgi:hypothetical protein